MSNGNTAAEWTQAQQIVLGGRERYFMQHPSIGPKIRYLIKHGVRSYESQQKQALYEAGYTSADIQKVGAEWKPRAGAQTIAEKEQQAQQTQWEKITQPPTTPLTPYLEKQTISQQVGGNGEIKMGHVGGAPVGTGGQILFMSPKEYETYGKKTTEPVWEIESQPTGRGMAELIDIESKYAGQVQIQRADLGYGVPRGVFEQTAIQIEMAKKGFRAERDIKRDVLSVSKQFEAEPTSFRGAPGYYEEEVGGQIRYGLGPSYFETLPSYKARKEYESLFGEKGELKEEEYQKLLKEAKQKFMGLEKGTRVKGRVAEFQLATFRTGIGLGQSLIGYTTKLGVQTISKETEMGLTGFKTKGFEFGGKAKEIMAIPTVQPLYKWHKEPVKWAGEVIRERPAVALPVTAVAVMGYYGIKGGIGAIQQYGLKTGVVESAKIFSPLRIRETYFVPDISKEFVAGHKAKAVEWRYGPEGKQAIQFTSAKTDAFGMQLKQVSYSQVVGKQTIGTSVTELSGVPYAKYVGGKLTFGTMPTQEYASFFAGVPKGAYGFKADVLTARRGGGWTRTQTGGLRFDITKPLGEYKTQLYGFAGGERVAGFEKVGRGLGTKADPSTYRALHGFEPTLKGYGVTFDISQPPIDTGTGVKIFSGALGKKSSSQYLKQLYGTDIIQKPITKIKPSVDISGISQITKPAVQTFGGAFVSTWAGTGMYERYAPSELLTKPKPLITTYGRLGTGMDLGTRISPFVGIGVMTGLKPTTMLGQEVSQTQLQLLKQKTKIRLLQKQKQVPSFAQTPSFNVFATGYGMGGFVPILPPPPRFGGGWERRKMTKKGPKQEIAITPSLSAAILGLRGAKAKYIMGKVSLGVMPGIRLMPKRKKRR